MTYAWNWGVLVQSPYLEWLGQGIAMTLAVSTAAWVVALGLGTLMGVGAVAALLYVLIPLPRLRAAHRATQPA